MIFYIVLSVLLFGSCHGEAPAKGLVYYPPYVDPYADQNPCTQFNEWNLQEGTFIPPKQDQNKECRGSFNNIPFIAPKFVTNGEVEAVEDFAVDSNIYNNKNYNIQFTCKDQAGRVKSGLYFWVYLYRASGVIKSFSYQTTMTWDTEGKLLFQPPTENRPANISCRYYDSAKGYITAVRTWRLTFVKSPTTQPPASVEMYQCSGSSRPTLSTNREVNVVVTSNRLEFYAFCPVVSCQQNSATDFSPVSYTPTNQQCSVNPTDPASYPICVINPLQTSVIGYTCSAPGTGQGAVKINIQSGARFTNDEDFKPLYFKEDDRDSPLYCSVDPKTAPDSVPIWEFLSPSSYGGQYQPLISSLYKQINEMSTGKHRLIITTVKPEHEGSYRCQIPQSSRIVSGGKPIYGYYFVKVYGKPQCTPYDGATSQQLNVNNGAVNIDLRLMSNSYITMQCSQSVVTPCHNAHDVCEPIAILRKDSQVCSMSNTTVNFCGGTQKITTSSTSPGLLRIDVTLNNNGGADASVIENVRGSYVIQLVYPAPANLHQDVPFTINAAPPTAAPVSPLEGRTGDGGLWWIVLIVAGVILIVLILFVIGYCLRQSGQTYPVDKKERDAGHDPVKELKDAGFTDFSSQPAHGGSEPSISGSVKVPEDTDSLGEYGEIDPTKFNEDGSFIHQYGPGQHPAAAGGSAVTPASAIAPRPSNGNGNMPLQQVVVQPQQQVPPAIPGPPQHGHHRSSGGPAPPPRPERSAASRQALQQYPQSGGTNV